jgi:hypothetical protein
MAAPNLISELSQTAGSNGPDGASTSPSELDDYQRAHAAFIAQLRDGKGHSATASVASAATTDIGAVNSLSVEITGTTGITSLGTTYSGPRLLRFAGALTLTHSASLNLPGAVNIYTAAGDTCLASPNLAANGWNVYAYQRASSGPASGFKNVVINGGFTVNQRAYVSGATLAAGSYGHDRWKAGAAGGNYSFTQLASNTVITIASGKSLIQVVEDRNVQASSYVLSWSGTAQARYAVNSATPTGSYAASPIQITGQTPGATMSIEFNGGTLGEVLLAPGTAAMTFEQRPYPIEAYLCKRYYETGWSGEILNGSASAQSMGFTVRFDATKRITPSSVPVGLGAVFNITADGFSVYQGSIAAGNWYQPGTFTCDVEL